MKNSRLGPLIIDILKQWSLPESGAAAVGGACNQNCYFCTRGFAEDAAWASRATISQRLKHIRSKTDMLVFTGGEPTLNPNLETGIREAAACGFKTIRLDTNGLMLAYPGFANKILFSGLTHIVFTLASHDSERSDSMTRFPGAWELTFKGIMAAAAAPVHAAVCMPLLKENLPEIHEYMHFVTAHASHVRTAIVQHMDPFPGAGDMASPAEIDDAVGRAALVAKQGGLWVHFRPGHTSAPCAFGMPHGLHAGCQVSAAAHGQKETAGESHVCGACVLRHSCGRARPGAGCSEPAPAHTTQFPVSRKHHENPAAGQPGHDQYASRDNRLVVSRAVTQEGLPFIGEALLRINYHCSQECLFCFIEPGPSPRDDADIKSDIHEINQLDVGTVIISGGEPTLNRNLAEYIGLLKKGRAKSVSVQTNAVLLENEEYVRTLARAGLDFAVVSLHSHVPSISNMLTGLDGSFEKTLCGIANLKRYGIKVLICHVINSFNYYGLPDFVRFSASRLDKTPIVFSATVPEFQDMMNENLIPRHSDIRGNLMRALDLCYALRVPFYRLSTPSGFPFCILNGDLGYFHDVGFNGPRVNNTAMVKTPACSPCDFSEYCYGVHKHYLDYYGDGELHPVSAQGFSPDNTQSRTRIQDGNFIRTMHDWLHECQKF